MLSASAYVLNELFCMTILMDDINDINDMCAHRDVRWPYQWYVCFSGLSNKSVLRCLHPSAAISRPGLSLSVFIPPLMHMAFGDIQTAECDNLTSWTFTTETNVSYYHKAGRIIACHLGQLGVVTVMSQRLMQTDTCNWWPLLYSFREGCSSNCHWGTAGMIGAFWAHHLWSRTAVDYRQSPWRESVQLIASQTTSATHKSQKEKGFCQRHKKHPWKSKLFRESHYSCTSNSCRPSQARPFWDQG